MNVEHERHKLPAAGIGDIRARLTLVLLCLIWGVTWPLMKIALNEIPPLSMRSSTAGIGALTLFLICLFQGRSFRLPNAKAWAHVAVASLLNIVAFSLLSAFAQIAAATSRVTILAYTLPIWALLLAWACLGERPSRVQGIAVVLCAVGLAVLIGPLATRGIPLGLVMAIGTGLSWAAGSVYLKWARIAADPIGVASWQLTIAFVVIAACLFLFEGGLHLGAAHAEALFALLFSGMVGTGIAYAMWFAVLRHLPAATASLGILGTPVVGVLSTVFILGERPTGTDLVGFTLIFTASACAILVPRSSARPTG